MKPLKIAIVGAGAIGSYYGARLAQAGNNVTFLARSNFDHIQKHGITVQSIHGDFSVPNARCAKESSTIGAVDLVILAWKTTANAQAKEVITPLLAEHTKILTLQNGLGNAEHLGKLFGIERILGGLCFVCINLLPSGIVSHTASGLIRLAWANQTSDAYLDNLILLFKNANIRCESVDNLEQALWMKLIWNFPFNGLAISHGGVDTKYLLTKENNLEPEIRNLMHEIITVGRALGHDIPFSMIEQQIKLTRSMDAYKPSSMIDFVENRPVEFDAIWLIPLEVATKLGVPTTHMKALTEKIKFMLKTSSI